MEGAIVFDSVAVGFPAAGGHDFFAVLVDGVGIASFKALSLAGVVPSRASSVL